jgi:hypothetical protein
MSGLRYGIQYTDVLSVFPVFARRGNTQLSAPVRFLNSPHLPAEVKNDNRSLSLFPNSRLFAPIGIMRYSATASRDKRGRCNS